MRASLRAVVCHRMVLATGFALAAAGASAERAAGFSTSDLMHLVVAGFGQTTEPPELTPEERKKLEGMTPEQMQEWWEKKQKEHEEKKKQESMEDAKEKMDTPPDELENQGQQPPAGPNGLGRSPAETTKLSRANKGGQPVKPNEISKPAPDGENPVPAPAPPPVAPSRRNRATRTVTSGSGEVNPGGMPEIPSAPGVDLGGDMGEVAELSLAERNALLPPEQRMYAFSIVNGEYAQLLRMFGRMSGLAVIGDAPQGKITFVSAKELTWKEAIGRINVLLFKKGYWMDIDLRNELVEVARLTDLFRIVKEDHIYRSKEDFLAAEGIDYEFVLLMYTPESLETLDLTSIRDFLPDYVRVARLALKDIQIFALGIDIKRFLNLEQMMIKRDSTEDPRVLKIITLKHIYPSEAIPVLEAMVTNLTSTDPAQPVRRRGAPPTQPETGFATDLQPALHANDANKTLWIRALPEKIVEVEEVLSKIDVPPDDTSVYKPVVIKLQYAPVDEIYPAIVAMVGGGGDAAAAMPAPQPVGGRRPRRGKQAAPQGMPAPSGSAIGTGNAQLFTEPRSNSLIYMGDDETLAKVRQAVDLYDVPEKQAVVTERVPILNADVSQVHQMVQQIVTSILSGVRPFSAFADDAGGALILSGDPADLEIAKRVIADMDVASSEPTSIHSIKLENAMPGEVVNAYNTMMGGPGAPAPGRPRRGNKGAAAGGGADGPKFYADDASKTLYVQCTDAEWTDEVEPFIRQLDEGALVEKTTGRLVKLKYATPEDVVTIVNTVFGSGGPVRRGKAPGAGGEGLKVAPAGGGVILAGATEKEYDEIVAFIEQFDVEDTGSATETRIFTPEHIAPEDAAKVVRELLLNQSGPRARKSGGGAMPVETLTISEMGASIVVKATPERLAEVADLINSVDKADAQEPSETRTYTLAGVDLTEVVATLESMFGRSASPAARRPGRSRARPTPAAPASTNDAEVKFVSIPSASKLLVSAPTSMFAEIEPIIEMYQEVTSAQWQVKMIPVEHADPAEMAELIEPILTSKMSELQSSGTLPKGGTGGGRQPQQAFSLTPDSRNSQIIIAAPAELAKVAEELVAELDRDTPAAEQVTRIVHVQNSDPAELAETVKTIMGSASAAPVRSAPASRGGPGRGGRRGPGQAPPVFQRAASASSDRNVNLVPLPGSRALVISGYAKDVDEAEALIRTLDAEVRPSGFTRIQLQTLDPTDVAEQAIALVDKGGVPVGAPKGKGGDDFDEWKPTRIFRGKDIVITTDSYAKTMLVACSPDKLAQIQELVSLLEEQNTEEGSAGLYGGKLVYTLQNAPDAWDASFELEKFLEAFWGDDAPTVNDLGKNILVIKGNPAYFDEVRKILAENVDIKPVKEEEIVFEIKSIDEGGVTPAAMAAILQQQLGDAMKLKVVGAQGQALDRGLEDKIEEVRPFVSPICLREGFASLAMAVQLAQAADDEEIQDRGDSPKEVRLSREALNEIMRRFVETGEGAAEKDDDATPAAEDPAGNDEDAVEIGDGVVETDEPAGQAVAPTEPPSWLSAPIDPGLAADILRAFLKSASDVSVAPNERSGAAGDSGLAYLTVAIDTRTGALRFLGDDHQVEAVTDLLWRLADFGGSAAPADAKDEVRVLRVKNLDVYEAADLLWELLYESAMDRATSTGEQAAAGPRTRVFPDEIAQSLILRGPKADMPRAIELLATIDRPPGSRQSGCVAVRPVEGGITPTQMAAILSLQLGGVDVTFDSPEGRKPVADLEELAPEVRPVIAPQSLGAELIALASSMLADAQEPGQDQDQDQDQASEPAPTTKPADSSPAEEQDKPSVSVEDLLRALMDEAAQQENRSDDSADGQQPNAAGSGNGSSPPAPSEAALPQLTITVDEKSGVLMFHGDSEAVARATRVLKDLQEQFKKMKVPADIRVYRVKYIDVNMAADILEQMFNAGATRGANAAMQAMQMQQQMRMQQMQQARQLQMQQAAKGAQGGKGAEDEKGGGRGGRDRKDEEGEAADAGAAMAMPEERIRVYPDARQRTLVIRAGTEDFPVIRELLAKIDKPTDRKSDVEIIQLTKLKATEVEATLKEIFGQTASSGSRQRTTGPRGMMNRPGQPNAMPNQFQDMMELAGLNTSEGAINPSQDIKISAMDATNTLLVVAPQAAMESVKDLVKRLEDQGIPETVRKQFVLQHTDVADVAPLLEDMFTAAGAAGGGGGGRGSGISVETATVTNAVGVKGPVKFSPDPRTNSIFVLCYEEDLAKVEEVIKMLDVESPVDQAIQAYWLECANARDVAQALQDIYQPAGGGAGGKSGGRSDNKSLRLVAEQSSNGLLVWASPAMKDEVARRIKELDDKACEAQVKPRPIAITQGSPEAIARSLQEVFGGGSGKDRSQVKITGDNSLGQILVVAPDNVFEQIETLAKEMDKTPNNIDMRIFTLKYAVASEVLDRMNEMTQSMMRQLAGSKGLKMDVFAASADPRTNSVIVMGGPLSFALVEKVLEQIDQPPSAPTLQLFKVFQLIKSNPNDVSRTINNMYGNRPRGGVDPPHAEPSGANAVLVRGTAEQIQEIEAQVISKLEEYAQPGDPLENYTIKLQYAKADEVAESLNNYFTKTFSAINNSGGAGLPKSELNVSIVADANSNQLLVTATKTNRVKIDDLLETMDTEDAAQTGAQLEVFTLTQADPNSVANAINTAFRRPGRVAPRDQVNAIAENSTRSVAVNASAANLAEIRKFIERLDVESETTTRVVEVYPLKIADAGTVQQTVSATFGGGRSSPQDQVQVSADFGSNAIVVSATQEKQAKVKALIEQLDTESAGQRKLRTIKLQYANAVDLAQNLSRAYQQGRGRPGQAQSVTINADEGTNSLIINASDDEMSVLQPLIDSLDVKGDPATGRFAKVYPIRFADPSSLAQALQASFPRPSRSRPQDEVTAAVEAGTNSLVVTASAEKHEDVAALLAEIDQETEAARTLHTVKLKDGDPVEVARLLTDVFIRSRPGGRGQSSMNISGDAASGNLLVYANEREMQDIAPLIQSMDVPPELERDRAVRTFRLKYADPRGVANMITQAFRPAGGRPSARDNVAASADSGNNAVVVTASPANMERIASLIEEIDKEDESQRKIHVITLKYADGAAAAQSLQETFRSQARGGGGDAVTVSNPRGTNNLVIRANDREFEEIETIVAQMDKSETGNEVRIVALQWVDANEALDTMQEFLRKPGGSGGGRGFGFGGGGSDLVGGVRLAAYSSTNSIAISGESAAVQQAADILAKIDVSAPEGPMAPKIIQLQYASAKTLEQVLTQTFSGQASGGGGGRGAGRRPSFGGGGGSGTLTTPVILGDETTKTLIIRARPTDYVLIEGLVEKLDTPESVAMGSIKVIQVGEGIDITQMAQTVETALREAESYRALTMGVTADPVSVLPEPRTRSIIVAGAPQQFASAEQLVGELREMQPPGGIIVKPVKTTISADEMKRLLEQVIEQPSSSTPSGSAPRRR